MDYRRDIDGLRSVAVLLVILNHIGFTIVPGGFVGVDVFFVLSGFLITSIIAEKLDKGAFSFSWFFVRRIKRLMPVLFFIVSITALFFTFIMLPEDLSRFYKSIIWVTFYLGNFYFWREHGGYFGGDAEEAPLLHTWSLAVEEQYYFIWPVILLVTIRLFGLKKSIYIFIVLFLGLTYLSQLGTQITIGASYYLLPTRFFELMAGSILALTSIKTLSLNRAFKDILSVFGLGMILGSAVLLSESSVFPGYNALLPVIGTLLLIVSQSGVINRLLEFRFFVFTGKISYSMYLWHWPIFTYLRYSAVELTFLVQVISIFLVFLLSFLTWRYVEQPFRLSNQQNFKPVFLKYFLLPALILSAISMIFITNKGFPNRFDPDILKMEKAFNSHVNEARHICHAPFRDNERMPSLGCIERFSENQNVDIFIFGDSHANHFVPFVHYLAKNANLNVQDYTLDQCMPVVDLLWGSNPYKANKCLQRNDLAMNYIRQNKFKYVVFSASWPGEKTQKIFTHSGRLEDEVEKKKILTYKLRETFKELESLNVVPVIIEDSPDLGGKSPKCSIKNALFNKNLDCTVYRPENLFFKEIINDLQKEFPSLIAINPRDILCKDSKCFMELEGVPIYRDDDHLNQIASSILGKLWLNSKKVNPFLN